MRPGRDGFTVIPSAVKRSEAQNSASTLPDGWDGRPARPAGQPARRNETALPLRLSAPFSNANPFRPAGRQTGQAGRLSHPTAERAAFTLLEVVLAVAILSLVGISIYRFLEVNLQAIKFSTENNNDTIAMEALIGTIQAELNSLPEPQAMPGALLGEAHKFKDLPADELRWITGPGNGLFTEHADDEFDVTLRLLPDSAAAKLPTLGLRRVAREVKSDAENWLPLMEDVRAIEFRYFDSRQNAWLESWAAQGVRPALVRVRIWRHEDVDPYEAILPLPRVNATARNPRPAVFNRPGNPRGPLQPGPVPALEIQK